MSQYFFQDNWKLLKSRSPDFHLVSIGIYVITLAWPRRLSVLVFSLINEGVWTRYLKSSFQFQSFMTITLFVLTVRASLKWQLISGTLGGYRIIYTWQIVLDSKLKILNIKVLLWSLQLNILVCKCHLNKWK